jgi:hypothetical protein
MKKIFTLLLTLLSFYGFSQPTAFTVSISPAGPYSPGQMVTVLVNVTGTCATQYNVNIRLQDYTSGGGCSVTLGNGVNGIQIAANATSGSKSYTLPSNFDTNNAPATNCTVDPKPSTNGTPRYIRAFLGPNTVAACSNPAQVIGLSSSIVLPVELVKFDVKNNNKSAMLSWTTASEKDNARFDIEHSTDGRSFAKIGEVKGNGTTYTAVDYSFEHPTPAKGVNYYRLHQIDYDGKNEYSPVRSLILGGKGLIVKNTIAKEAVTVVTDIETPTVVNIYNSAGQQVISNKTVQGEYMLDISALQNGLYIIRTATGDVARFTKL